MALRARGEDPIVRLGDGVVARAVAEAGEQLALCFASGSWRIFGASECSVYGWGGRNQRRGAVGFMELV